MAITNAHIVITTHARGPNEDHDGWAITAYDGRGHMVTLLSPSPTPACHRSVADTLASEFGRRVAGRGRRRGTGYVYVSTTSIEAARHG